MFSVKRESAKNALCLLRMPGARGYAASAAVQPQRMPPTERPFLPAPAGLKFTRLSNGLFLVTVDNRNAVSRISLVFKAGTRYETTENRGIVHRIRNLVGLSTGHRTAIEFNYHVANFGGVLSSAATRDHLSIDIQVPRSSVYHAFAALDELVGEPFHVNDRELEFSTDQLWYEKEQLKENWPAYTFDKLHKVAFRQQGLANSLLSPKYAIGKHKAEHIQEFASRCFVTGNAVLVATGVDHEDALKFATKHFSLARGPVVPVESSKKFFAGDVRKQRSGTDLSLVHIAGSGAGLSDIKGAFIFAVLAKVLGDGPSVKWSEGGQGRLASAVRKVVTNPFRVTATNTGYDDTGVFSLFYASQWQDSADVAKALVGEVRAVATGGISDTELQAAKNKLKYQLLSLAENDDYVVEDLGVQASARQPDIHLAVDQARMVDAVSVADIQQAAKQLVSGKFAVSAIGRLEKTPYCDELA